MSEEFLCARCARHTRTCCQDTEIHVTLGDLRRITPHANHAEFFEFRPPNDPVYEQHEEDPFWHRHVFREDGTRRVLRQRPNGDCFFLSAEGCVLPADARPLICRLFPFDYKAEGIATKLAAGCPVELLAHGKPLLTELGMRLEEAQRMHAQLYAEICETEEQTLPNTAEPASSNGTAPAAVENTSNALSDIERPRQPGGNAFRQNSTATAPDQS